MEAVCGAKSRAEEEAALFEDRGPGEEFFGGEEAGAGARDKAGEVEEAGAVEESGAGEEAGAAEEAEAAGEEAGAAEEAGSAEEAGTAEEAEAAGDEARIREEAVAVVKAVLRAGVGAAKEQGAEELAHSTRLLPLKDFVKVASTPSVQRQVFNSLASMVQGSEITKGKSSPSSTGMSSTPSVSSSNNSLVS